MHQHLDIVRTEHALRAYADRLDADPASSPAARQEARATDAVANDVLTGTRPLDGNDGAHMVRFARTHGLLAFVGDDATHTLLFRATGDTCTHEFPVMAILGTTASGKMSSAVATLSDQALQRKIELGKAALEGRGGPNTPRETEQLRDGLKLLRREADSRLTPDERQQKLAGRQRKALGSSFER